MTTENINIPRVFISYSHETAAHKRWVLELATTLRLRGIDIVLDQWDLKPGDDLPHFMETELNHCDYVIMVCSEEYVKKANAGSGGVGYEKMIITSEYLQKITNSKIIPIVRQSASPVLPTFLKSKVYVNFSNDLDVEYSLDELQRTILEAPLFEKPEIGANPFLPISGAVPDRTADGLKAAMTVVSAAFEKSGSDDLKISSMLPHTNMHRLKLQRYMSEAVSSGYLSKSSIGYYKVTDAGYDYMINHGIIED